MGAITARNLSPEVARAVREKAKREKLTLNRAVVKLLCGFGWGTQHLLVEYVESPPAQSGARPRE